MGAYFKFQQGSWAPILKEGHFIKGGVLITFSLKRTREWSSFSRGEGGVTDICGLYSNYFMGNALYDFYSRINKYQKTRSCAVLTRSFSDTY